VLYRAKVQDTWHYPTCLISRNKWIP